MHMFVSHCKIKIYIWIFFAQVAGRFCGQEMLVQPVVSDWNWGIISRVEDAVCTPRVHHMA